MLIPASEVDEASVVVPGPRIGSVAVDGRLLLVDEEAGRGHALNPTAALIWQLLDSVTPLGTLIDEITAEFAVPRDEVSESVIGLVRNLGMLGLLENVEMSWAALPIDVEYVDADCEAPDDAEAGPEFDDRYLANPPNA